MGGGALTPPPSPKPLLEKSIDISHLNRRNRHSQIHKISQKYKACKKNFKKNLWTYCKPHRFGRSFKLHIYIHTYVLS